MLNLSNGMMNASFASNILFFFDNAGNSQAKFMDSDTLSLIFNTAHLNFCFVSM